MRKREFIVLREPKGKLPAGIKFAKIHSDRADILKQRLFGDLSDKLLNGLITMSQQGRTMELRKNVEIRGVITTVPFEDQESLPEENRRENLVDARHLELIDWIESKQGRKITQANPLSYFHFCDHMVDLLDLYKEERKRVEDYRIEHRDVTPYFYEGEDMDLALEYREDLQHFDYECLNEGPIGDKISLENAIALVGGDKNIVKRLMKEKRLRRYRSGIDVNELIVQCQRLGATAYKMISDLVKYVEVDGIVDHKRAIVGFVSNDQFYIQFDHHEDFYPYLDHVHYSERRIAWPDEIDQMKARFAEWKS